MARLRGEILALPPLVWHPPSSLGYSSGSNLMTFLQKEITYRGIFANLLDGPSIHVSKGDTIGVAETIPQGDTIGVTKPISKGDTIGVAETIPQGDTIGVTKPALPISKGVENSHIFSGAKSSKLETCLNVPAVETLKWSEILPYISPVRRRVVEVILKNKAFLQLALRDPAALPGPDAIKKASMPVHIQEEMIGLGYVYPPKQEPVSACPIFLVPRSDGKFRVIWDGRSLNAACHAPPPFHFRSLTEQLAALLDPSIAAFITLDFQSWFVQIKPHRSVARFFATRLKSGVWILAGLPMGWAWAPVIAQFVAEGFIHRLEGFLPSSLVIFVYIDNVIIAIPRNFLHKIDEFVATIKHQASLCGIVIKKSSWEIGKTVTWLGTEISARDHRFRIKPEFVKKLEPVWNTVTSQGSWFASRRTWYVLLSCLIHLVFTSQDSLCMIHQAIEWMSMLGKETHVKTDWEDLVCPPEGLRPFLGAEMHSRLANVWRQIPPEIRPFPMRAVGFSDASEWARAWAIHTPSGMFAVVSLNERPDKSIFHWELLAMIEGQGALIDLAPPESSFLWFGDNTAALFVSQRGLSCVWENNPSLLSIFLARRQKRVSAQFCYIPSELNPTDGLSRTHSNKSFRAAPCVQHPGVPCPHFFRWLDQLSSPSPP